MPLHTPSSTIKFFLGGRGGRIPLGVILLVTLQVEACNCTKSKTPPYFFHVFWIVEIIPNRAKHHIYSKQGTWSSLFCFCKRLSPSSLVPILQKFEAIIFSYYFSVLSILCGIGNCHKGSPSNFAFNIKRTWLYVNFYFPWNYQRTYDFLMISETIEVT